MANLGFDLTGKVALVTGGNGGIGLGMAEALAESGADVCIWGRNEEKNQVAEQKLKSFGRRVLALKCDVSDKNQVEKCFAKVLDEMGAVHACFANAGIGVLGTPFHEMSIDEWRKIFGINMEGVFFTFIRGIAVEYAKNGIRANAILPGWIETDMTADFFKLKTVQERILPRVPQSRWGVPADFGPIAVYFASDASVYHSGDAVVIDGGYSCF